MKVAVAQLTSGGAIAENLAVAVRLIGSAAQAGAHAVFLPEATDFIAPPTEAAALTRSAANAEFVTEVCGAAKTHRVWVSVGVHEPPSTDEARCFNTQLLIDETGAVRERYRKLHLYDVDIQNGPSILESNTTIPGTELRAPVDTPVGKLGVRFGSNPAPYVLRYALPRSIACAAETRRRDPYLSVGVCDPHRRGALVGAAAGACDRDAVLCTRRRTSRYVFALIQAFTPARHAPRGATR